MLRKQWNRRFDRRRLRSRALLSIVPGENGLPMSDTPTRELELYWLNEGGFPVRTVPACPFVAAEYSRYKHGAAASAAVFARCLEDAFQETFPHVADAARLLIASSPYKYVPTAAHALALAFLHRLNERRHSRNLPAARLIKIGRLQPSPDDYGQFSAGQRHALMRANSLSVDRTLPRDSHLVIIDDIKVTGAHQNCLMAATDGLPLLSRTFLHIARFVIPSSAALDPTIEDRLNHASAKGLSDLVEIVRSPDFAWNARLCRFLLSKKNRTELSGFLTHMPGCFVLDLSEKSRGDGYDLMDAYRESYTIVETALRQRRLTPTQDMAEISNSTPKA
jgi:hypothetical protein